MLSFCGMANAQSTFKIIVKDAKTSETIPDVAVVVKDSDKGGFTDSAGSAVIRGLNNGTYLLMLSVVGYEKKFISVHIPDTTTYLVVMEQDENRLTEVFVSSTRDDRRVENAALKVEVVDKEEMQEEQATRPANVIGVLGDIGGIRVQQTSAVSGNANIRMQGLEGKYTQLLRDGVPLYDGLSGGFGILQIQPLDLKQIELIKGAASTLYGGGAIGGLINFISKKPSTEQQGEFILNQNSLTETSASMFVAKRYRKWGYTFFSGYTHQDAADVNNDGFSDLPKLQTINIHPKLFFYPDDKTVISAGYSGTIEQRSGGDMNVLAGNSDSLHQYYETDKTNRNTGELVAERKFTNNVKGTIKSSVSDFDETIQTNSHYFEGNQWNYFAEASAFVPKEKFEWVAGIDLIGDKFIKKPSDPTPLHNVSNNTTGAFGQATMKLSVKSTLQTGLRIDQNATYGTFVLPSIAFIHHFNDAFGTRAGFGMGYKTPNALDQQSVDYRIEQLLPIGDSVKAEYSYGYNLEFNYKKEWAFNKRLFINTAFFITEITKPVVGTEQANNTVVFNNMQKPVLSEGFDTYAKLRFGEMDIYLGYTHNVSERKYLATNQFMPLTPGDRVALSAAYEIEGKWRFGVEADYTGKQYRDSAAKTPDYFTFGLILEKDFKRHFAVILSAENLLDYRQSRYENLYTGPVTQPDFKPVWGPIDGRVISIALRYRIQ